MQSGLSLFALALLVAPASAQAAFHLWDITEVYSNADGSVQYVEFFTNANFEDLVAGHTLASISHSGAGAFVVPNDLPNDQTANKHFLIATPEFVAKCGSALPDYTFAAGNFFSTVADTLNWANNTDLFSWSAGQLPTNGYHALHEDFGPGSINRRVAANSPTNYAGQVCLPEPSGSLLQLAGLAGVFGLDRWRRRRVRRPGHS